MRLNLVGRVLLGCFGCVQNAGATLGDKKMLGQSVSELSALNMFNWLIALVIVLCLFFVCVWMLRKLNSVNGQSATAKMRIVGGVALGLREKVVLLQVGSKQLVLAVTPGRIETLTILEGDACLTTMTPAIHAPLDTQFAQKLMQALKGQSHE